MKITKDFDGIKRDKHGFYVINGNLHDNTIEILLDNTLTVRGDVVAEESITSNDTLHTEGTTLSNGNIFINGKLISNLIKAKGNIYTNDECCSFNGIKVGGNIETNGRIYTECGIDVRGYIKTNQGWGIKAYLDITAKQIESGSYIETDGNIKVSGDIIATYYINVKGNIETDDTINTGTLIVGTNVKAKSIQVKKALLD